MSLAGVQQAIREAEESVSPMEAALDVDLETEDQSEAMWTRYSPVGEQSDPTTPEGELAPSISIDTLQDIVTDFSIEVAQGTDGMYRKYMYHFDAWLQKNQYMPSGTTIFGPDLPENTPLFIVAWIMSHCDVINPDGTPKGDTDLPSTYSHAMKLRSTMTYGFGRRLQRGTRPWSYNPQRCAWDGNPSVSDHVARYMVALRKRKHAGGDRYAMSSRAITSDIIRSLYSYNQADDRTLVDDRTPSTKRKNQWGNPRRRLLVHAVVVLAFSCLLRLDEALNLRFEDIQFHNDEHIEITLDSRKTHPFGGSKPFHLWRFRDNDQELCPILSLANWIKASGLKDATGYIFRAPGQGGCAPSTFIDQPISSASFVELFRNNLIDLGLDPSMYGGHSCRRGGCQWLVREKRWPILRICDWGGWSSDFSHSSILKYLFSWNDNPYEAREDYFNPDRRANKLCSECGRTCWC